MLVGGQKAIEGNSCIEEQRCCVSYYNKGKLKVLKMHYRHLGSCSVDSAFDDSWKEEVDEQVSECSSASKVC